jgi:hypothetical protein
MLVQQARRENRGQAWAPVFLGIGVLARIFVYGWLFWLLYRWWPEGIGHRLLGPLTLGEVSRLVALAVVGILLFKALLNPIDEETIRRAWAWLGLLLVTVLVCVSLYFNLQR